MSDIHQRLRSLAKTIDQISCSRSQARTQSQGEILSEDVGRWKQALQATNKTVTHIKTVTQELGQKQNKLKQLFAMELQSKKKDNKILAQRINSFLQQEQRLRSANELQFQRNLDQHLHVFKAHANQITGDDPSSREQYNSKLKASIVGLQTILRNERDYRIQGDRDIEKAIKTGTQQVRKEVIEQGKNVRLQDEALRSLIQELVQEVYLGMKQEESRREQGCKGVAKLIEQVCNRLKSLQCQEEGKK